MCFVLQSVFDFALKMTSSVSQLEVSQQLNLPGIATAFKQHGMLSLMSLMTLSPGVGARRTAAEDERISPVPTGPDETRIDLQTFRQHNDSADSGLDDEIVWAETPREPTYHHQPGVFCKKHSSRSLPDRVDSSSCPETANKSSSNWKKFLGRSMTRPELRKKDDSANDQTKLQKLLIEAMLILHEAETTGSILDDGDSI